MTQLQITLPDTLSDWIEAQVRAGRYVDAGDYLRDLIRHDQNAAEELLNALDEGAASGTSARTLEDVWQSAKSRAVNG
jgi:antitoxin ParD1/3/4